MVIDVGIQQKNYFDKLDTQSKKEGRIDCLHGMFYGTTHSMTVMGGTMARGRMVSGGTMMAMGDTTTVWFRRATGSTTTAAGSTMTQHDDGNEQFGDGNGRQDDGLHNDRTGQHGDGRHDNGVGSRATGCTTMATGGTMTRQNEGGRRHDDAAR